jgi:type VI secretion system protein ImpJ
MKMLSKVVWSDGMYLGPHHFQVQNRYFEDLIHFEASTLWYESWGFIGYTLDAEALQNGTVALIHARGVLPDGLPFQMPESDPLPPPRSIAEIFPPTQESLTLDLALPAYRPQRANCDFSTANNGLPGTRYRASVKKLYDENTGMDEKPVRLGQKNFQILLESELTEDFCSIPLGRVVRDGSGHYVYDRDFIPPCLQLSSSERLMGMARSLIDVLQDKSSGLSLGRQSSGKLARALSAQEVETFWFLHAINSGLSALRHLYFVKRGHPEELFTELSRLAGALCTFGMDSHPRSLPLYDHRNLQGCFQELEKHILQHLEILVPTNCVSIPLRATGKYIYAGEVADQRALDRARWILAVHSAIGEVDLIQRARQLVKVCSAVHVEELVKRGLQGLALTHLPVPPSAISPKVDTQYFSINRAGPCWEYIVKTRRVGVYVPGELPAPEVEILVILDV